MKKMAPGEPGAISFAADADGEGVSISSSRRSNTSGSLLQRQDLAVRIPGR